MESPNCSNPPENEGRGRGAALRRLLIIDDEPSILSVLRAVGERAGWRVTSVSDSRFAASTARELLPDRIIMDIVMPEMDGFEVLRRLAIDGCEAEILLLSGFTGLYGKLAEVVGSAAGLHVRTAPKPISLAALEAFLEGADWKSSEIALRNAERKASRV